MATEYASPYNVADAASHRIRIPPHPRMSSLDYSRIAHQLGRLVAVPSVSSHDPRLDCSNRGVAELIAIWLEELGFRVEWVPVQRGIDKVDVVATLGYGEPGLVLSGHTDTVPCDEHGWDSDPFRLTERDGRLVGLGAADMKAFFPLVLESLQGLNPDRLRRSLVVCATADEESSMAGVKALQSAVDLRGARALIGEPTGLRPIRAHKGVMMEVIRIFGRSGHASDPASGRSALEGMNRVITALLAWREELQRRFRDEAFAVQVPTMNLGHVHGGESANKICAECELHVDLRILSAMQADDIRAEMREVVGAALRDTGLTAEVEPLFEGVPPLDTDPRAEVVQVAEALTGKIAGSVAFGTEGPYLQQMGLETIVLGAGDIARAHQPNEYVPVAHFEPMVKVLKGMIEHFCLR
ncbi:MAG: Acetylornithine deacetylase [Gammaproteobacteria bacterium]|nr:Acetylornithine deacetylase [Gammaproteobacteria bacterium]